MAVTKILPRSGGLQQAIDYVLNGDKTDDCIGQLRSYYEKTCPRLVPEIATELIVLDKDAQPALESSAGYKQFLIGAPHYLLLMSAPHSYKM